jgi:large subunit ribosomal protein L13
MLIDGTNLIMGRAFSVIAKKALLGENVDVINCEKFIILGNKQVTFAKYLHLKNRMGVHSKGPFYSSNPDKFCKRIIRGMVPHKQEKGELAMKKIMFYIGEPEQFKGKDTFKIKQEPVKINYITIGEVCHRIGGWKK